MGADAEVFPLEGGCDCRHVRYRMEAAPMFVHCCHCRWCQRETGSAFALNAVVETTNVTMLGGAVEMTDTPSASGKGQKIARCPHCKVALWSHYPQGGPRMAFIRAGTLDQPDHITPDIHIYTSTMQPWVVLPADARAVPEFYDLKAEWPAPSFQRLMALMSQS